ncbi:hypothetical protein M8C21_014354, partial [Ambrosia artemisiifolia]
MDSNRGSVSNKTANGMMLSRRNAEADGKGGLIGLLPSNPTASEVRTEENSLFGRQALTDANREREKTILKGMGYSPPSPSHSDTRTIDDNISEGGREWVEWHTDVLTKLNTLEMSTNGHAG